MMKMSFFFLVWLLAAACSKGSTVAPAPPVTPPPANTIDTAYLQYGTPYTGVVATKDVIMYQVNFRSFSSPASFTAVQARLDSIKALGVNTLYLMPVYPVGVVKSVNSPYCVKDYFSVNPEFGTMDQLRSLVDAAHQRNMTVLFDWVADHTSWDNSWIANKAWYQQDAAGNIISPPNTGWADVAGLNYKNAVMRQAMIRAMKYWIYHANIDGYRCDAADFVPFDFWQQAIDSLRGIATHKLLLFAEGTRTDHFTAGFDLEYGMGFYYNMVNNIYAAGHSVKSIDSVNTVEYTNAGTASQIVRYISNHDVDNSDGTPLDLLGGKAGSLAAFTVAATMKGVPMIYDGQEVGCPIRLNFFNNSTIIDWTLNPDMKAAYKALLAFRSGSEALKQGNLMSYSNDDVCVFTKTYTAETVLVMVNLRNTALVYNTPSAINSVGWKDAFSGNSLPVGPQVNLSPYQVMILEKQ